MKDKLDNIIIALRGVSVAIVGGARGIFIYGIAIIILRLIYFILKNDK